MSNPMGPPGEQEQRAGASKLHARGSSEQQAGASKQHARGSSSPPPHLHLTPPPPHLHLTTTITTLLRHPWYEHRRNGRRHDGRRPHWRTWRRARPRSRRAKRRKGWRPRRKGRRKRREADGITQQCHIALPTTTCICVCTLLLTVEACVHCVCERVLSAGGGGKGMDGRGGKGGGRGGRDGLGGPPGAMGLGGPLGAPGLGGGSFAPGGGGGLKARGAHTQCPHRPVCVHSNATDSCALCVCAIQV